MIDDVLPLKRRFLRRGEGISRFGKISYPTLKKPLLDHVESKTVHLVNDDVVTKSLDGTSFVDPSFEQQRLDWLRKDLYEDESLQTFEKVESLFCHSLQRGNTLVNEELCASVSKLSNADATSDECLPPVCKATDSSCVTLPAMSSFAKSYLDDAKLAYRILQPSEPASCEISDSAEDMDLPSDDVKWLLDLKNCLKATHEFCFGETATPTAHNVVSQLQTYPDCGAARGKTAVQDNGEADNSGHVNGKGSGPAIGVPAMSTPDAVENPSFAESNECISGCGAELKRKLVELSALIEKLKSDSIQVEETKLLYQSKLREVDEEKLALYEAKQACESEQLKLRHERIMLDKLKAASKRDSKKDQDGEVSKVLRDQLSELQSEMCLRESKWSDQRSKLKSQAGRLEQLLTDKETQIEKLQKLRDNLQKANTKLQWENDQMKLRLRNRDKQPPIISCDCNKENYSPTIASFEPLGSRAEVSAVPLSTTANQTDSRTQASTSASAGNKKLPSIDAEHLQSACTTVNDALQAVPTTDASIQTSILIMPDAVGSLKETDDCSAVCGTANRWSSDCVDGVSARSSGPVKKPSAVLQEKLERIFADGWKEIIHPNGTVERTNSKEGLRTLSYVNGDTKRLEANGTTVLTFAATKTTKRILPNGVWILTFADGQEEEHLPDGNVIARFANGYTRQILPSGESITTFPNGETLETRCDGSQYFSFQDGSKELRTQFFTKREFPDGAYKMVFPDGSSKSHYANGRLRIRDASGNIISDEIVSLGTTVFVVIVCKKI